MVTAKVAELTDLLKPDQTSEWVSSVWRNYQAQRGGILTRWQEIDAYLYATDTTSTSNMNQPWTHNTTLPKLTNIRDNLHSNYMSSLFPNDKWLTWVPFTKDAAKRETARIVLAYMENKTREGNYKDVVSQLLYDYIDKGNAFAMPSFETRYKDDGFEKTPTFIGPRAVRIDPLDIVFNPLAADFEQSYKIVRSIRTIGELQKLSEDEPDYAFFNDVVQRRRDIVNNSSKYGSDDWVKSTQYSIDGFGSLEEYYQSNSVEILDFYGDFYDAESGMLERNKMITIVDRSFEARKADIPTYGGGAPIRHVGWRKRSNNMWAMSPMDNLVGMQYMLDHYLNMGANALDLKVMAPKKIIGEVEEFVWGPNEEIHIDENGDVQEMAQNFNDVFTVKDWIEFIESKMELYAGAPREAMGIRTPGEKTAFEVQSLENASGRIFQEKINQFEEFSEDILNDMLEISHRNLDKSDIVRIIDDEVGVTKFVEISKSDISADGILRPVGARHFAQKANELQNLIGIFDSSIGQLVMPHTSSVAMSRFVEDVVDLRGYNIFRKNVAVEEQQELQQLMGQAEQDNMEVSMMDDEPNVLGEEVNVTDQVDQRSGEGPNPGA